MKPFILPLIALSIICLLFQSILPLVFPAVAPDVIQQQIDGTLTGAAVGQATSLLFTIEVWVYLCILCWMIVIARRETKKLFQNESKNKTKKEINK